MNQNPILFLLVPNISLFMKKEKEALGLSLGASFVAGSIEKLGFPLDYYDFNYALREVRNELFTPQSTLEKLFDGNEFVDLYFGKTSDQLIDSWIDALTSKVSQKQYGAIGLSLDVRDTRSLISKASLSFAVLLARALKRRFNVPVILGGKNALSLATPQFLQLLQNSISEFPIDLVCQQDAYTNFAKLLSEISSGLKIDSKEAHDLINRGDHLSDASEVIPKYLLKNNDEIVTSAEELFPTEILAAFPKLQEVEPFLIAPYKFSFGCPFTCAFCTDGLDRKFFQFRSEKIVNVLANLQSKGIKNFGFYNNNINLNRAFLDSLEKGIRESGIQIQFSDSANLQNSSSEIFQQLARIGAIKLWFGSETVSTRILKIIDKNLDKQKIIQGLTNADSAGIWSNCNFIYNFPHETQEEFEELFSFISTSPLVNGFDYNEFRLVKGSAYLANPQKFGIELLGMADTGRVGAFDEIGRYKWNDRLEIGKEKTRRFNKLRRAINYNMTYGDHILFAARSVGYSKIDTIEIMKKYTELLRNNKIESRYNDFHKMYLPRTQFEDNKESNIAGHTYTASKEPSQSALQ